jgi:hypothetical protein
MGDMTFESVVAVVPYVFRILLRASSPAWSNIVWSGCMRCGTSRMALAVPDGGDVLTSYKPLQE